MDDSFAQAVKVHKILGEPAERQLSSEPTPYQRRFVRRLVDRSRVHAHSFMHQLDHGPELTDSLDETIDEQLLHPARRAMVQRTVTLERWLAEHGFRGGSPIRFVRSHRPLHFHGDSLNLPTARPVYRHNFEPADPMLTERVLDGIQSYSGSGHAYHRRPAIRQAGRVSVVPGFVVLELAPLEFQRQFGVVNADLNQQYHVIAELAAGPVIVCTQDHGGETLAHTLEREYTHELAALEQYRHSHTLPAPGSLIQQPGVFRSLSDGLFDLVRLDRNAQQLLAERARHLAHDCQTLERPLTLTDLGFTADDWIPLAHPYPLDDRFVAMATTYLATLLLGRALIAGLNTHPEARSLAPFFPRQAFADVICTDAWHPHYTAAHQYLNFVRAAQAGELNASAIDQLYSRIVEPSTDFHSTPTTNRPVRLHVFPNPLHDQLVS